MLTLSPRIFLLALSLIVLRVSVQAQLFEWNGSVSDDWATEENWTPNGVPGPGDSVWINSDAVPNSCLLNDDKTIAVLVVSAGVLDLGDYQITATTSASIADGVVQHGTLSSPSLGTMNNATFYGAVNLTKTGATNNDWYGGNTFHGPTTITNNGTARLRLANTEGDVFNDEVQFINNSASTLDVAYRDTTFFNGLVTADNSSSGGITFGNSNTATAVSYLQSGAALLTNGFSNGRLIVRRMTQSSTDFNGSFTPTTATFTSCSFLGNFSLATSGGNLTFSSSSFTASNTFSAEGNISMSGLNRFSSTSGSTSITRNGGSNNSTWAGSTVFGDLILTNNSTFFIRLAGSGGDTFARTAQFVNTSSGGIQVSYSGSNTFGGDITLTNSGSGGITFGAGGGTSTQSSGGLLTDGYSAGALTMTNFTQSGTSANERITPTAFTATSCSFAGDFAITTSSGAIALTTCSFLAGCSLISASSVTATGANQFSTVSGSTEITMNGGSNSAWTGGNTFGNVTFTNNSTAYLRLANSDADDYNGTATFIQTSSGALSPAYNGNSSFAGDVSTAGTTTAIEFGSGSGRVIFDGSANRTLYGSALQAPVFQRLTMNIASGGNLLLDVPIEIVTDLTMTQGILTSSATNMVSLRDETTTTTVGNALAYINGPMQYGMNSNTTTRSVLNFPIGKGADWRPVSLQVAHSTSTDYTYRAEVQQSSALALGYTLPPTVQIISQVHYWEVERYLSAGMVEDPDGNIRTASGQEPQITLYFGTNDVVFDGADLVICKNTAADPGTWIDIGGTGAPAYSGGDTLSGSVTSTSFPSAFNSFSIFTLGSFSENPLPIAMLDFQAAVLDEQIALTWKTATELHSREFVVERSADGLRFAPIGRLPAAGNSSEERAYQLMDDAPLSGVNYYRLALMDEDGSLEHSPIIQALFHRQNSSAAAQLFPNPNGGRAFFRPAPGVDPGPSLSIYTLTGERVLHQRLQGSEEVALDLSALRPGWYTLHAGTPEAPIRIPMVRD
jgi:hypothetical protein